MVHHVPHLLRHPARVQVGIDLRETERGWGDERERDACENIELLDERETERGGSLALIVNNALHSSSSIQHACVPCGRRQLLSEPLTAHTYS